MALRNPPADGFGRNIEAPLPAPLTPTPALLCKLGSIVVHADEMLSADGHHFDKIALQQLIADPEVAEWIKAMNAMAMVPVKRR